MHVDDRSGNNIAVLVSESHDIMRPRHGERAQNQQVVNQLRVNRPREVINIERESAAFKSRIKVRRKLSRACLGHNTPHQAHATAAQVTIRLGKIVCLVREQCRLGEMLCFEQIPICVHTLSLGKVVGLLQSCIVPCRSSARSNNR